MWQLPDDLASVLKDFLRGARYVVRRETRRGQDAAAFVPVVPGVARLADSVLTATEKTASTLLLGERPDFADAVSVQAVFASLLAARDDPRRRQMFVRLHYRLTEAVLRRLGVENAFISEHEIAAAHAAMRRRHRRLLGQLRPAADGTVIVRFWAAAAVCLAARHPLRELDPPRTDGPNARLLEQAPMPYCLLTAALTGAILTMRLPTGAPPARQTGPQDALDDCIDSAAAVVTARFGPFTAALTRPDAVDALTGDFAAVLPFLP